MALSVIGKSPARATATDVGTVQSELGFTSDPLSELGPRATASAQPAWPTGADCHLEQDILCRTASRKRAPGAARHFPVRTSDRKLSPAPQALPDERTNHTLGVVRRTQAPDNSLHG